MKNARRKYIIWLASISIAVSVLIIGCGGESAGDDDDDNNDVILPPTDLYPAKIEEAWVEFESVNYNNAIASFREASEMDPLRSPAYLGLGWCYALLDGMDNSLSNFDIFITKESESPDGYAAEAFVFLAQNEYEKAITAANEAISLGGDGYVFSHIPDVQTRSLRLLIAESYYAIGQYEDAQAQIDILEPDNGLDEGSRTYEQDLLLEIEDLKSPGSILEGINN